MSTVIEELRLPGVSFAEVMGEVAGPLWPEEEEAIAGSVSRRRAEFISARVCARRAMVQLGLEPAALPTTSRGAVRWPMGVVGSITHCPGYRAAAVAREDTVASVGIDAEPDLPLPTDVLGAVTSAAERTSLGRLRKAAPGTSWDRLLFCAKESLFKLWYPMTRRELAFDEAQVDLRLPQPWARHGEFQPRLTATAPPIGMDRLQGRWLNSRGLLVCGIMLPARPPA